jgi:hypothetical protein
VEARPEVVWGANLVEFTLTSEGEGTRLRVVESGFDRLELTSATPAEYADRAEQAWDAALAALAGLMSTL